MGDDDFEYEEIEDDEFNHNCPKCGRDYNEIDYEYQYCSKCGWDDNKKTFGAASEPTYLDYMNGDADILTGRWY